jgi:beta-xylosidase
VSVSLLAVAGVTGPRSDTTSKAVAIRREQDFANVGIRVGDAYYYSAPTRHYSPGAPILRSYDLVNWEFAEQKEP